MFPLPDRSNKRKETENPASGSNPHAKRPKAAGDVLTHTEQLVATRDNSESTSSLNDGQNNGSSDGIFQSGNYTNGHFSNAGVQLNGNNFNVVGNVSINPMSNVHDTASPDSERMRAIMDSLKFDQMDARQMTIKNAHAQTCKWLLKTEEYHDWLNDTKMEQHHGFFWIKGKPGAGKSTLMKYALNEARKKKDTTVIYFFFNARGEELEKTVLGTYQSLLFQLLDKIPRLQSIFDAYSTIRANEDHSWDIGGLQDVLRTAILRLGNTVVVCYIDALDECVEDQIRDMIEYFEDVSDDAAQVGVIFRICFASRFYPRITMRHNIDLHLDGHEGHKQDIANYIRARLNIGHSKPAERIRAEVQEKAAGVFMWVVLVIGILKKEHDKGNMHDLQRKLRDIPQKLHDLFLDILTRDSDSVGRMLISIQWILFAQRPLRPDELYYAIQSGDQPEYLSQWDKDEITIETMTNFILTSSKGLAEITKSKNSKVQFIHESVRDFLLKEKGLSKIGLCQADTFEAQSHDRLKVCCMNYLAIDVFSPLGVPDDLPKATDKDASRLREAVPAAFPFLEYASQSVLHHTNQAQKGGISQTHFLDNFPRAKWIKIDNLLQKYQIRRHTPNATLLYILAERNMSNLIKVNHSASLCLEVEDERYGTPFFAAAASESEEAERVILEHALASENGSILLRYVHCLYLQEGWTLKEFNNHFREKFTFSKKNSTLSSVIGQAIIRTATSPTCSQISKMENMFHNNVPLDWQDKMGRTLLSLAAGSTPSASFAISGNHVHALGSCSRRARSKQIHEMCWANHPSHVQLKKATKKLFASYLQREKWT